MPSFSILFLLFSYLADIQDKDYLVGNKNLFKSLINDLIPTLTNKSTGILMVLFGVGLVTQFFDLFG